MANNSNNDGFSKWVSLIVVVIGAFMAILDTSIVNVAIPKFISVFGCTIEDSRWIITAYSLAMGAVIPLTGYLCHNYGTKKIYIFALIAFSIGSLLCAFSWNIQSMIFFRVIQGIGGGLLMPVSMAIIYEIVERSEIGIAMGIWGISAMAAPAIGPTLSGYIIQYLDWRLIFTINVPIGLVGVLLSMILLKEHAGTKEKSFDFIGFLTSTSGLVLCLYVLGEGNVDFGDFKNILMLITGTFLLILFVANELTHEHPLLDLRLLKIPVFSLSIVIASLMTMALFGLIFLLPLYLQSLMGYTPMQTGLIMLPSAIVTAISMPFSGKLSDKYGARVVMLPSLFVLLYATYELSTISAETSMDVIVMLTVIRGVALGFCMMPASTTGLKHIATKQIAGASALSNTIRQISSAISITVITSFLQHQQTMQYYKNVEHINQFNSGVADWMADMQKYLVGSGMAVQNISTAMSSVISGVVQKQVFVVSFQNTIMLTAMFVVIVIPLTWFIREPKGNLHDKLDEDSMLIIQGD